MLSKIVPRRVTPSRGLVLIRKVRHAQTEGAGSIILPERTIGNWTIGQAEVVAVGLPRLVEDCEDWEGPVEGDEIPNDPRLVPGAWIFSRPRAWVTTDRDDQWVIRVEDVLALLG